MNPIDRIREYKRLAIILNGSADREAAATIRDMCDADCKLESDRNRAGFSFLEEQAALHILTICRKCRPGVRDTEDALYSKAGDILLEINGFEGCEKP